MQSGTKPVTLELGGDGEFHVPTILTGVTTQSPAVRDEIFGTVSTVRTFDDEDEALALAAHDKYGLAAGVHTADLGRYAYEANPRFKSGGVTDGAGAFHDRIGRHSAGARGLPHGVLPRPRKTADDACAVREYAATALFVDA